MHDRIRKHFASLSKAIQKTQLTDERKSFVVKAIDKLEPHYESYRKTNASRSGDQIVILVQAILKELESSPDAALLDSSFREVLHSLHEELGIPKLALKSAPVVKKPARRAK